MQKYQTLRKKYFTNADYNKFKIGILKAKIIEKNLVNKSIISGFIDDSDLYKKIATLARIKSRKL